MRTSFAAVLLLSSALPCCFAQTPTTAPALPPPTEEQIKAAASMPFRNASLPIEQRVDDLVSRLTLEEKVSQLIDRAAPIPRLDVPAYNWWNEALHGVASGPRHRFPAGHRTRRHLGCTACCTGGRHDLDGSAGQVQRRPDSSRRATTAILPGAPPD